MTGPPPLMVEARRVLLEALDALEDHRGSLVLVGAQAVYLRTDEVDAHHGVTGGVGEDVGLQPAQVVAAVLAGHTRGAEGDLVGGGR